MNRSCGLKHSRRKHSRGQDEHRMNLQLQKIQILLLIAICCCLNFEIASAQQSVQEFSDGAIQLVVPETRGRTDTVTVLPQDEIWLIDARNSHVCPHDLSQMSIQRFCNGIWCPADLASLVASHSLDKTKSTMIYIHGNRTDEDWARSRGLQFYNNTFSNNGNCRPAVRFVIYSWRSEREMRRTRGVMEYIDKSERSVAVGCSLADILTQFEDRRIVLTGFSLGVNVVISALNHPAIQFDNSEAKGKFRVAFVAPALDGCFARSLLNQYPSPHAVERADIFTNAIDRALRGSKFANRRQCPDCDISIQELASRGNLPLARMSICDLAGDVGKQHTVTGYTGCPAVQNSLNQMLQEIYFESSNQNSNAQQPTMRVP